MVGLGDQREPLPGQALDQPQLPQRLGAVELLGEDARRHPPELILGARRGERRVAHVVLDVEGRVVDPEGPAGLGGRVGQLLAKARHEVQPALDVLEEVLVAGRRPLEDHDRADVHVARGALVGQEGDVHRAEPIHVSLGHVTTLTPAGAPATITGSNRSDRHRVAHQALRKRPSPSTGSASTVRRGSILGFLGPNGAGKTTTLRILLGLAEATSGTATIDGHPYRSLPAPMGTVGAVRRHLGLPSGSPGPQPPAGDRPGSRAAGQPSRRGAPAGGARGTWARGASRPIRSA